MKRSLLVLLVAVLLPSLLLSGLALRSAQEQQIVLERRTAELCQRETYNMATAARSLVNEQRRIFGEAVERILATGSPADHARTFAAELPREWPQQAIGFALDGRGQLVSPAVREAKALPEWRTFLRDNGGFLGGTVPWTVYSVPSEELNRPEIANNAKGNGDYSQMKMAKKVDPGEQQFRNVLPQQQLASNESQVSPALSDFRKLTADENEGVINRFVENRLDMIFWVRPTRARELIFGCLVHPEDMGARWAEIFETVRSAAPAGRDAVSASADSVPNCGLALLDDKAQPVAVSPAGWTVKNWREPFVSTEVGEALPHWEAALYLDPPEQLATSARQTRRLLYMLIGCSLAAVACGGWAVLADTRRQLALAQKKTDFVSNVSHELKTPLTSIRMFAELMHDGRAAPERTPQYLRIIMVEAERLTRLINNVLDFARVERKEERLKMRPLDFHGVISQVWEGHELHLREAGFVSRWEAAPGPYRISGDDDALAQALVNLLSNAEKYSVEQKEITLRSSLEAGWVELAVLDRGSGVPAGEEQKIFQAFYRAHDSLSSGIPGTGLGLSLALRVVERHGGTLRCTAREAGGSVFTLRLPLSV